MGETECRSWRNLPVHGASADLKRNMVTSETIVFVIDDDPSFCRSTEMLIEPAGLRALRAHAESEVGHVAAAAAT